MDEIKSRMEEYERHVKEVLKARSADISLTLANVVSHKLVDAENEVPLFYKEFTRVIDNAAVPHAGDQRLANIDPDPYVRMEPYMPR